MKYLAFDLETTGVDTATSKIWQVATDKRSWLVNPGVPIPSDVRELCRIDDALLQRIESAPTWDQIQSEVLAHLRSADALVTYNGLHFDVPVLMAHIGTEADLPPVIDARVLVFEEMPNIQDHGAFAGYKLGNVALSLGLATVEELEAGAHDARFDCQLTLKLFLALGQSTWLLSDTLYFQQSSDELQSKDWQMFGVNPEDGPRFLWFRSCRVCRQEFTGKPMNHCPACNGFGALHQTKKRRASKD